MGHTARRRTRDCHGAKGRAAHGVQHRAGEGELRESAEEPSLIIINPESIDYRSPARAGRVEEIGQWIVGGRASSSA